MLEGFCPEFVKGTQLSPSTLTYQHCLRNFKKNIETSIILDLNIIAQMGRVIKNKVSLNKSGLEQIVELLNSLYGAHLVPGFALNETLYPKESIENFEFFLKFCCPQYHDAYNASIFTLKDETTKKEKRNIFAYSYLSLLQIQLIDKLNEATPFQKYAAYLDYMAKTVNLIGSVKAEIAQYCFFNPSNIKDKYFQNICFAIKKNFKKKGKNKEETLKNASNSAWDIYYYKLTALRDYLLDSTLQDSWLLTADNGLKALSRVIYYPADAQLLTTRHSEQQIDEYWTECTTLSLQTSIFRSLVTGVPKKITQENYETIWQNVEETEYKIGILFGT